jgi:TetR/AcrR family transcriptional regulator, transcriptional repressor for nem operon
MNTRFTRGAATKARIIRAAADLFHKQGVGATSPDEVIEASETGKGQFYHYFKSKERLVHEVLQAYLDEIAKGAAPLSYEIDSWDDLELWFFSNIELQKRFRMTRGCPFGTIGNEVTENDELIRQDLSLIFEVVKNKLAAFFIKEKAKGQLSQRANEEQMADFCIATIQGAMLLGKIKRNSHTVETIAREALAHLKHYTTASQTPGIPAG